jgi:hypothetical protein
VVDGASGADAFADGRVDYDHTDNRAVSLSDNVAAIKRWDDALF